MVQVGGRVEEVGGWVEEVGGRVVGVGVEGRVGAEWGGGGMVGGGRDASGREPSRLVIYTMLFSAL